MGWRGFTLVELLVTLAIGAILLAIAIPGYAFLINANRLSSVTNDLVTSIQFARSEAIKLGKRVTVCKASNPMASQPSCNSAANWQDGWLVFVDGGMRGVVDSGDTLLRVQDHSVAEVNITTSNYDNFISYLPRGMSQGSNGLANGTLRICVAGNRRDVIINTTGRPRLGSGSC